MTDDSKRTRNVCAANAGAHRRRRHAASRRPVSERGLFRLHDFLGCGGPAADALLSEHGAAIVQLLRNERQQLSGQERDEVLRHRLSYYTTDVVWRPGTARSCTTHRAGAPGVLEILEFANSQLLEFRYYDHLLDVELARTYARLQRGGWRPPWIGRRYARTARQIHALFIDVNELTDKAENALKIAGDVYAARLFAMAAARLGLDQWKGNVREKLKTRR